jgi:hypothetical protein
LNFGRSQNGGLTLLKYHFAGLVFHVQLEFFRIRRRVHLSREFSGWSSHHRSVSLASNRFVFSKKKTSRNRWSPLNFLFFDSTAIPPVLFEYI